MFDIAGIGSKELDRQQLSRIEAKVNLILEQLGIKYLDSSDPTSLSDEVCELLDDGKKIEAIKLHRQQTGAGLREAKIAIDAYRR